MGDFLFPMKFGDELCMVSKLKKSDYSDRHIECIRNMRYENKRLIFDNANWKSILLGAGEEKAVYAVCDENKKVFALELIDERYYLNGRLIEGEYFGNITCKGVKGQRFNPDSLIGLCFTGLVRPREFVYGFEWGMFRRNHNSSSVFDGIITEYLHMLFHSEFEYFSEHFKDVHDRNVMFEILPRGMGKVNISFIGADNVLRRISVNIRGIDLR